MTGTRPLIMLELSSMFSTGALRAAYRRDKIHAIKISLAEGVDSVLL